MKVLNYILKQKVPKILIILFKNLQYLPNDIFANISLPRDLTLIYDEISFISPIQLSKIILFNYQKKEWTQRDS